ncbi:hypothetical protein CKN73_01550 [Carnobacterium divergens]|uniref:hypothetical protein n=1 Tax=Carnobacterium divergens TaxID=2748 RepID=UPI001071AE0E|nr:hypothetical protein [Carnobacterium divergens]TFJ52225.1 hypothetical protein CKN73_01550 [Carnobacterium divergens]TFJ65817.1 hypothetical protein CKN89_01550 [Carnobacterium divergens]TFJ74122.1 hypothetical protein CKN91_01545 [Carnobacterium divergens]TFJ74652.1 hypothetical protein CKN78_01545 [Carnobacterium divergens]
MADIVKVLNDGVEVYPRTHASAVLGLTTLKGDKGATGATGPAGQNATTTAVATTTTNGLMAAADKAKLNSLASITFEKVGTV